MERQANASPEDDGTARQPEALPEGEETARIRYMDEDPARTGFRLRCNVPCAKGPFA